MSAIAEKMEIEPMREAMLRFFRPGEVVDEQQLEELLRWRLQDFGPEPEDGYVASGRA